MATPGDSDACSPSSRVSPPAHHQSSGLRPKRRPAWPPEGAKGSPANEMPMPAAQGVGAYQEAGPSVPGEEQRRRGQDRPVPRPESESAAPLSGQHLDLVAQNHRLEVGLTIVPAGEQPDEAAQ